MNSPSGIAGTPSLKAFILASINRPQAPRLRISQAGADCTRRVFYEATGAAADVPTDPDDVADAERGEVKMAIGTAFDAYALAGAPLEVQEEFRAVPQKAVEITFGSVTVRGMSDMLFISADGKHVVDLKTVGMGKIDRETGEWKRGTWEKVQKEPKQEHAAQTNLYAYGLGAETWSVCYVNANTGEILEHAPRPTDAFEARKDFGLFEEVAYWIGRGEAPPRPFEDHEDEETGVVKVAADSFPCAWCDFRSTCWPGTTGKEVAHVAVQET